MPAAVLVVVVIVSVDLPELPAIVGGLNPQEAPVGKPTQESPTEPLKPNVGFTDTVELAEFPAVTGAGENALAESSKPAGVVLSNTPDPAPQGKIMSMRPSLFISATKTMLKPLVYGRTVIKAPKVPSPFPNRTPA